MRGVLGKIYAHHRSRLREPVTFEYRKSKFPVERVPQFTWEFFCSGNQQSDAGELFWLRVPEVGAEKGRRSRQQRDMIFLDQFSVLQGIDGSWIGHDSNSLNYRMPKCNRAPKTVEEGKRSHYRVSPVEVHDRTKLHDVADDVPVAKNNSFRFTGGAAGEKDDGFFLATFHWNIEQRADQPAWHQQDSNTPGCNLRPELRNKLLQPAYLFRP